MEHADLVRQVEIQAAALRAAVLAAGPDTSVPTCPGWTVQKLVAHVARVHGWAAEALRTSPTAPVPDFPSAPRDWDELLAWWDERRDTLLDRLRSTPPDAPAWTFSSPDGPSFAGFWARRQAHETAVHRLDAEHALAGSDNPSVLPTLLFEPEFAADGIEEMLFDMMPRVRSHWAESPATGRVLLHAADVGRAWEVRLAAGELPEVGPTRDSATTEDASIVGTADAVYRATWGRPSTAVRTGDATLLAALRTP
ncbi:maleylpyruvate isomerase family protein [Solihabitans fulvus]|uniref:Maleylpyruvate isomerase family protein n=1 Tax=Solihabitans fulvus TaxID=1892852 RepID=A0A5B2XNE2_9PSEU|nr:maleylpyruvate isomerase N-terminal domain-containing protein [Solihabitans fulvus]KAA2264883.1 maleylpyruvate isomerase family protein [Solihabitans fulvus]